jgi:RNA polymerase sigma factor (sigma-70 family)
MTQLKTSSSLADEQLIFAIQSGGHESDTAIMQLYGKYCNQVRSTLYGIMKGCGHSHADPSDILHDSFIVMLHKIQHDHVPVTSIFAFWLGIAKYHWLNYLKKAKYVDYVADPLPAYGYEESTPESLVIFDERFKLLDQCLCKCGSRCREILIMWLSDYSMEEIAQRLHLSGTAMARKIKHECFKKLRKLVIDSNIFNS